MKQKTLKNNLINILKIKRLLKKLTFVENKKADSYIDKIEISLSQLQMLLLYKKEKIKNEM